MRCSKNSPNRRGLPITILLTTNGIAPISVPTSQTLFEQVSVRFKVEPLISIVCVLDHAQHHQIHDVMNAFRTQSYSKWELISSIWMATIRSSPRFLKCSRMIACISWMWIPRFRAREDQRRILRSGRQLYRFSLRA